MAQNQVVPQSGVDWKKSSLVVSRFQPTNALHNEIFKCFGTTYDKLPVEVSLFDLGYENSDSGPLTLTQKLKERDCFQQAGLYEVTIELHDYAGNVSEHETILTVTPAELSLSDSTIDTVASKTTGGQGANLDIARRASCTSPSLVADGKDECVLEVNLRDRFGNVIKPEELEGKLSIALPLDEAADNLDATRNPYGAFLAGLYFDDHLKSLDFQLPQADNKLQVGLRSYVPSLDFEKNENTAERAYVNAPKNVNISMKYDPSEAGKPTITTNKKIEPLFSPWVRLMADLGSTTTENFTLMPLNRTVRIPFVLSGVLEKELPPRLSLDWSSPRLESLNLRFEDSNDDPRRFREIVRLDENPTGYELKVSVNQREGVVNDTGFRVNPALTYLLQIKGENTLVRYPLSIVTDREGSLLPPFRPSLLSLATETLTERVLDPLMAKNIVLSDVDKILYSDWRRRASRNFLSLVRGQPPMEETEFNLNDGFGDLPYVYFKGVDLRLTGTEDEGPIEFGGGVKTIIVEDGNLLVDRDIAYASPDDSLGIIVINSRPGDLERGHLFVAAQVQRLVGTLFLDGALLSTVETENLAPTTLIEERESTPNQSLKAPLGRQLVFEGTLISRNTFGGADAAIPYGADGARAARSLALIYDLNYLRRYEPPFDIDGNRIADEANVYCYKPENRSCYNNPAPLIIIDDNRLNTNPPPAFESEESS